MPAAGGGQTDAESNQFNNDPLLDDSILNNGDSSTTTGVNWKHGRQLLRQYLQVRYVDKPCSFILSATRS